jgi:putative FmdB family regulatory protein
MPHYEFFCNDCKKFFAKILSLIDYEEGEVLCPHFGSKNTEQRWSVFYRHHFEKEHLREHDWTKKGATWPTTSFSFTSGAIGILRTAV